MVAASLIGVLAFLMAYLSELMAIKKVTGIKQILLLAFVILHGYALYLACYRVERFWLPAALPWFGWFLLIISVVLLIYSHFIEIPFVKAYTRSGISHQLITTGTFALVRHPGIVWYILFLISLLLITHSKVLLIVAPVWVIMHILWVVIQERFVLRRVFSGYEQYKHETPMFIPTKRSIINFIKNLKVEGGSKCL